MAVVVNFPHRPLYPRRRPPLLTKYEAGWVLGPVRTFWRRDKSLLCQPLLRIEARLPGCPSKYPSHYVPLPHGRRSSNFFCRRLNVTKERNMWLIFHRGQGVKQARSLYFPAVNTVCITELWSVSKTSITTYFAVGTRSSGTRRRSRW